jgi:hypothetical protein
VKSTKKESTKFSSKIAALLTWIDSDPEREDLVGLRSAGPGEIAIKRQTLAATFQIQNDSLMMNLKRQQFSPARSDGDWSVFTLPTNFSMEQPEVEPPKPPERIRRVELPLRIALPEANSSAGATEKWKQILDNRNVTRIPLDLFLSRVVEIFEIRSLPPADLFYMLSLVTFSSVPGFVQFNDFAQLYANFGEKNSLFPKMFGLLNSAAASNGFLVFECIDGPVPPAEQVQIYFSLGSSFGFVVVLPSGAAVHVRNDFEIPFFSKYLIDEDGNKYQTWDEVLEFHASRS